MLRATSPVVPATPGDLPYVVHLQKQHSAAIGFLPRAALAEKIRLGRIWLASENDEPAGFLHHGSLARPEVRIFQAAVQYDARRRHHGIALVNGLIARATSAGAQGISLRCLSFLDANTFWRDVGFSLRATEPGAKGTLNVWTRTLLASKASSGASTAPPAFPASPASLGFAPALPCPPRPFRFHSRLHPCPRCGRWTTDTWSRGAVRHRLCPACLATGA